ncbi:MAG: hypothetical protein DYG96_12480 [Chlorobi bacterium CHB2]|nr:hypothetical protein [Chlorobi bacterium CHB2]
MLKGTVCVVSAVLFQEEQTYEKGIGRLAAQLFQTEKQEGKTGEIAEVYRSLKGHRRGEMDGAFSATGTHPHGAGKPLRGGSF